MTDTILPTSGGCLTCSCYFIESTLLSQVTFTVKINWLIISLFWQMEIRRKEMARGVKKAPSWRLPLCFASPLKSGFHVASSLPDQNVSLNLFSQFPVFTKGLSSVHSDSWVGSRWHLPSGNFFKIYIIPFTSKMESTPNAIISQGDRYMYLYHRDRERINLF